MNKTYKIICLDTDFHELIEWKKDLTLEEAEKLSKQLKYTQHYIEEE